MCHKDGPAKAMARLTRPGAVLDCARPPSAEMPAKASTTPLHLELLIPGLPWTHGGAASVMHRVAAPTLERWLSRGRRDVPIPQSADQWLWRRFAAAPTSPGTPADAGRPGSPRAAAPSLPLAPVTLALDGYDPGNRWWLRADPVHFVVGRTGLRLAPPSLLQLREDESAALADSVRAHFPQAASLLSPVPARWYLGADESFGLETTSPADAIGDDVDHNLPTGPGRRQWLAFVNEVQMLWFEHPVNQARERRGEPVASGLWLHGQGCRPGPGRPGCTGASGGGALLAGLAALAGCRWIGTGEDATRWLEQAADGRWLLVLDALLPHVQAGDASGWRTELERLDARWLAPIDRALRSGRIEGIDLRWPSSGGLSTAHLAASDRFRFWRRRQPLATLSSERAGAGDA